MIRAKFAVTRISRTAHWDKAKGEVQTINLTPVMSGSEENSAFYAATPSGQIELGVVNAAAAEEFEIGAEYYVDFTKAGE